MVKVKHQQRLSYVVRRGSQNKVSNCAFANYPDEKLCIEAQQKLNDSYYMSVSLVSRLRKNSVEGLPSANTSLELAAVSPSPQSPRARGKSDDGTGLSSGATDADYIQGGTSLRKPTVQTSVIVDGSDKSATMGKSYDGSDWTSSSVPAATNSGIPVKGDKYFILKSLTLRDLELSVQSGIWATQSHNEETLNEAYKTCDNVYLIFSANKSGEYFGYARMASEINQDPAAAIEFAPTSQSFTDADIPKAIPTEATETTPRGRIVDDSARGTIFWEIQSNDADSPDDKEREDGEQAHPIEVPPAADGLDDVPGTDNTDGDDVFVASGDSQTWGKPFKLVWLSTTRLPFYRTRGLRNPLNANREIKIARDGTDVDVTIGRKLVSLFHQEAANSSAAGTGGGTGNSLGVSSSSSYASLPGTRAP
ncbi:hypothetical protein SEPCBS119000_001635 [Sporothrix epigloea]|uniref:YTH domain-containing protein n=1 Tax=Sporothrix epigloea TaxID=1892477 RepID=A0ABP0DDE4_9PEZI